MMCTIPVAYSAQNNTELANIHHKLNTLRLQQHNTENTRNHVMDALHQSELTINATSQALEKLKQHEAQSKSELNILQQHITTTTASINQQQQQLSELLHQLYIHNNSNPLSIVMGGGDLGQINRNIIYTRYLALQRNQTILSLQQATLALNALTAQQETVEHNLSQQHVQQEKTIQLLQQERSSRQQILQQLGTQLAARQQKIKELEENAQRITQLMQQLARDAAHRKTLALAKAAQKKLHHRHESERSLTAQPAEQEEQPPNLPDKGLALLKGELPMPTQGKLIHRYGTPREAGGTLWTGVFIQAPAGQAVVSVAAGEVVFANWLRGFGNLIIIDHGAGYMSLYSNNETLYKHVGDIVKANQTIAGVGNTGGNLETGLYFELRYRSKAFDPSSWLK